MALLQLHKNFYSYIKNKFMSGELNNYLSLFYSDQFSSIEKPPQYVCPDFVSPQSIITVNISQILSQANKQFSDIFVPGISFCKCSGKEEYIQFENKVELYLHLVGSNLQQVQIEWSDKLLLYLIKIQLNAVNTVFYINGFETGYYDQNNNSYTPYFWHITPLVCLTNGTDIYLKLDYIFSLPPSCE